MKAHAATRYYWRIRGIPVLNYHRLIAANDHVDYPGRFCITLGAFQNQLDQIHDLGCHVFTLEEVVTGQTTANDNSPAVLTFDDGHDSDYRVAFPTLIEFGTRADFFVNTATIGTPGFVTWRQIAEMREAGMSFNSHGHEHIDQSRLSRGELKRQLTISKLEIEDHLSSPVLFLSLPYGILHPSTLDLAAEIGYRAVCTSTSWPANPDSSLIGRSCIYRDTTNGQFRAILTGSVFFYVGRALRAQSIWLPKMLVSLIFPLWIDSWRNRHA